MSIWPSPTSRRSARGWVDRTRGVAETLSSRSGAKTLARRARHAHITGSPRSDRMAGIIMRLIDNRQATARLAELSARRRPPAETAPDWEKIGREIAER